MTESQSFPSSNFLRNTANATCKIAINMHGGTLKGNILKESHPPDTGAVIPEPACSIIGLDFQCAENSGYIPLI